MALLGPQQFDTLIVMTGKMIIGTFVVVVVVVVVFCFFFLK